MQNEYHYNLEYLGLKIVWLPFSTYKWNFYYKQHKLEMEELKTARLMNWLSLIFGSWGNCMIEEDYSPYFYKFVWGNFKFENPIYSQYSFSSFCTYPYIIQFLFALNHEISKQK